MSLHDQVREYYFEHINDLSSDKKFHFATRVNAWNKDDRAQRILDDFQDEFVKLQEYEDFKEYATNTIALPPAAKINAALKRQPFFDKYPTLRGLDFVLFKIRHALSVYTIDLRDNLLQDISLSTLKHLAAEVCSNEQAVRILSTYAVNYFFLLEILFRERVIQPDSFLQIAKGYNLEDPSDMQLYIYLFTHCIIGESNFYMRAIPQDTLETYLEMLDLLQVLIEKNYSQINLDNKLEFLVCAKICGYETPLFDRIFEECSASISPEGMFLIDTLNANSQSNKTSFEDSEHRNVLFIMSGSEYHTKPI